MAVESINSQHSGVAVWRLPNFVMLLVILVAGLDVWLFWDGLSYMWDIWLNAPEYSHAILIPPIAAFLVWQQKNELERLSFDGSLWGVGLLLLGGAMLVIGQLATIYTVVQYAYLVTLFGLVLSFMGRRAFRVILIPLFILFFMIPLPPFFTSDLSLQLQLLSSQLGVWFMRLFGISVYLQGNVIDLGGFQLQVAEACSGLRYLFPLMTMGFLLGYFYKGAFWKRFVLFLSSIPITVLMNSFRVGTIGIMVEHWGIGMAEGFLHEFQGWMLFMVCIGLMILEMLLLNRVGQESGTVRQLFGVDFPVGTPPGVMIRMRTIPASFKIAGAMLLMFAGVSLLEPRPVEVVPTRASFIEFPLQLGAWHGQTQPMEATSLDALKLDDYILADYVSDSGHKVNLYVAWYNSQRKGEAIHSPRSCMPGGGWQMHGFGQKELSQISVSGRALRVNRTLIELGNQRQLVYYWFQQRSRVITNEFLVKWYIFWDALTRHRTDGALIRLVTPVPVGSNETDADLRLSDFASRIAGELPRFVPN